MLFANAYQYQIFTILNAYKDVLFWNTKWREKVFIFHAMLRDM